MNVIKEQNIEEFARKVALETIKEYAKQEDSKLNKRIFQNTEMLLKNYKSLKEYLDNAIDDINKMNEHFEEDERVGDIEPEDIYINSIIKSKTRTAIMVTHVDVALQILKNKTLERDELSKYNILEDIYINKVTYEELASQNYCSVITVRRWKNEMVRELGVLLFGVDKLRIY